MSKYGGYYIKLYSSILSDDKFFPDERKVDETVRLWGMYVVCLLILWENKKGWAYSKEGVPMSDAATARRLSMTPSEWKKYKRMLLDRELIYLDEKGAWGVGDSKVGRYQIFQHAKYMKDWRDKKKKENPPASGFPVREVKDD